MNSINIYIINNNRIDKWC